MTNEEAIRVLNVAKAECEWNAPLEYQIAFDMAIEALKEQPKSCEYAVSAIAVEEMLRDLLPVLGMLGIEGDEAKTAAVCETVHNALDGLWKLPFVKPDSKESSFTHKALDSISRVDAIDAIKTSRYLVDAMEKIIRLPSVQPEIIRCKDCKHKYVEGMIWHCPFGLMGGENFFCGYGSLETVERRRDG